ncbi:calcium/sodium antiporter [Halobium salinum]|uniref:Calcium/sodium antiporter n=1 Tax=Halobium salinum TaxID=1364940 RepID=A0ABD5PC53_9EURY|nr:calcium/sodium antiporter [Halobium salinum]
MGYLTKLLLGIVLLYAGAEALVWGAKNLSVQAGVPAAVAGVTIIAFATTAPELFVGVISSTDYRAKLGLGAIVGSNIANIGLVLGITALIRPLEVDGSVFRRDVPAMVLAAVALVALGWDWTYGAFDGAVLLAGLVVFTVVLVRSVRGDRADAADAETATEPVSEPVATDGGVVAERRVEPALYVGAVVLALALLLVGSRQLINGGSGTMAYLGMGDRLIGLVVLAFGTSLPELAASVVGAVRGETDFSVGNVVGSNVYNILAVMGVVALMGTVFVPFEIHETDFLALLAFTAAAVGVMAYKRRVSRFDGLLLVGGYLVYARWFLLG